MIVPISDVIEWRDLSAAYLLHTASGVSWTHVFGDGSTETVEGILIPRVRVEGNYTGVVLGPVRSLLVADNLPLSTDALAELVGCLGLFGPFTLDLDRVAELRDGWIPVLLSTASGPLLALDGTNGTLIYAT